MIYEINQIRRWLAAHFGLPIEDCRILGPVPEGTYIIPIGVSETPHEVTIRDDRITIGAAVSAAGGAGPAGAAGGGE